jgi:hypothetical protein
MDKITKENKYEAFENLELIPQLLERIALLEKKIVKLEDK